MKNKILFTLSVLLALIAAMISWIWAYFANLVIGIPAALLSFFLWRIAKDSIPQPWSKIPIWLLMASAIFALVGLALIL